MTMKQEVGDIVHRLAHGALDFAQNRLKLLEAELSTELDRLGVLLARQILVALCALLTVQCLGMVLLAMVWDTQWRIPSTIVLTLVAAAATGAAYRSFQASKRRPEPIFASSFQELEKDRQALEKSL